MGILLASEEQKAPFVEDWHRTSPQFVLPMCCPCPCPSLCHVHGNCNSSSTHACKQCSADAPVDAPSLPRQGARRLGAQAYSVICHICRLHLCWQLQCLHVARSTHMGGAQATKGHSSWVALAATCATKRSPPRLHAPPQDAPAPPGRMQHPRGPLQHTLMRPSPTTRGK